MTTVEYLDLELLKHFIPKRATSGIVLEQGYLLYYGDIMVVTRLIWSTSEIKIKHDGRFNNVMVKGSVVVECQSTKYRVHVFFFYLSNVTICVTLIS